MFLKGADLLFLFSWLECRGDGVPGAATLSHEVVVLIIMR